jgi:hypothetical protein
MAGLAALLVLPLLFASLISAIVRQDFGQVLRTIGVHLPVAGLLTAAGVGIVRVSLAITDGLCGDVARSTGQDLAAFFRLLADNVNGRAGPLSGTFAIVVIVAVLTVAALLLLAELALRSAAVYIALLFLPLALAGLVWPATSRWPRRLGEVLGALVVSKFVIVAIISMAASAVLAAAQQPGFSAVITGTALLLLAGFAPFALLRLVPVVEVGAIGHLEGTSRRMLGSAGGPLRSGSERLGTIISPLEQVDPPDGVADSGSPAPAMAATAPSSNGRRQGSTQDIVDQVSARNAEPFPTAHLDPPEDDDADHR